MEVSEITSEGLSRAFKVTVPANRIDAEVESRIRDLAATIRLPGFRPGKVPARLMKRRFGQEVMAEVLQATLDVSWREALEERGLRAATVPKIEITAFAEGADLEYNLAVELFPEITPIDFSTITLERLTAEPGDAEFAEALDRLAHDHQTYRPPPEPRAAKEGDVAIVSYTGRIDGEAFEGGKREGVELVLSPDTYFWNLGQQLIGMGVGETRMAEAAIPSGVGSDDLTGEPAVFEVEVTEIRELTLPTVDDAFAAMFGMADLEALRTAMRGQMEQEFAQMSRARLKRSLLDRLDEGHSFAVPAGLVDEEYAAICRSTSRPEGADGGDDGDEAETETPNADHDHHGHDHHHEHDHDHDHDHDHEEQDAGPPDAGLSEADKAEYRILAERRVRLGLLMAEVGRLNNIEVSEEELRRRVAQQAAMFPGSEKQIADYYRQNPEALASLRGPIFEDKVVDFMLELATVTDRAVSAEELMRPDPEDGEDAGAAAGGQDS